MIKPKVLIADDEPDIRELLAELLEDQGCDCILAADAYEAIKKFQDNEDIDLVMSDIRMPGKTGLDLLSEIKEIDSDVVVVMISAVKDIESAISAMSKGAYDYVTKPFKLTEVSQIAQNALEKRRLSLEVKEYQRSLERMVEEKTVELKEALRKLEWNYNFTLKALVTALESRDEESGGHSLRVVRYSLELARLMGITDKNFLKVLYYGSLLHDIGKIGIPDAILKKQSALSDDEWEIMKTHPIKGYKYLHRIEFLEEASQIVLHHHEKYDGSGYPDGLEAEHIPLGSRIFSVADMIDAITSGRPYQEAKSFEDADDELTAHSGKQFDPQVVRAFKLKNLEYWKELKKKTEEDANFFDFPELDF